MIEDIKQLSDGAVIPCDLCIVGSGAAGLAIANELLGSSLDIVIAESGSAVDEADTQRLYECVTPLRPFPGAMEGRFRTYGGSTTRWGGQALRLDPMDFEHRPWIPYSGWPIRYDEMVPYYERASAFLLTDPHNFDTDLFQLLQFTPPAVDARRVHYHFSKWSRHPDLRNVYGKSIAASKNVRLVMHANLVEITLSDNLSHVSELTVRSLQAKTATIRPKHLVLCTGGIETARILLSCNRQAKNGIGNDCDLVGRFFQDHPGVVAGAIQTRDPDELQRLFNTFYHAGLKYAPRLSMTPAAQTEHRVLSVSAYLRFDDNLNSPYQRLKDTGAYLRRGRPALRGEMISMRPGERNLKLAGYVLNALLHLPSVSRPVYELLFRHRAYTPSPVIKLCMNTEQEPISGSRITLSNQTDAPGTPKAEIHWKLTEMSLKTVRAFCRILEEEFEKLKLGRIEPEAWIEHASANWEMAMGDQYHHMGTARMADSPRQGVVDRDGRVHGIDNLHIAGSATFPTGGHSNPTLTLIALAIRMADRFKKGAAKQ